MGRGQRKGSYSHEELLECAHGRLFGPGNARLPLPPLLMMDRITTITEDGGNFGKGQVVAEYDISPGLWFFKYHFESDPVMPGALGLDAMWQLLGFYLGWTGAQGVGRALRVGEVRFNGQVRESARRLVYQIDVKRVIRRKIVLGFADGRVLMDGQPIYDGKDLCVGLFTSFADAV